MESIRAARPTKLYVAGDGPRNAIESGLCARARLAATSIDWPCRLVTLFQDDNLGCRRGVTTAIDWFFEQEEAGIILEDDVLPNQSFFPFCAELLERYRDDTRISAIAGTNLSRKATGPASYYFSRIPYIWGWATWRRAWSTYDRSMAKWEMFKSSAGFKRLGVDGLFEQYYTKMFSAIARNQIDTWDYQLVFSMLAQNTFAIVPQVNMVANIGFGMEATHTKDPTYLKNIPECAETRFPMKHPELLLPRLDADLEVLRRTRLLHRLRRVLAVVRK